MVFWRRPAGGGQKTMPKPEFGTPKWISTQWKKKGLSKLRWHCGLCGVWCKDANGFKMHLEHPNHLARAIEQEKTEDERSDHVEARYCPDEYSEAFERSFLRYLATHRLGERVKAHEAYRVLNPDDRPHANMKRTCWGTLGRFVADLRERGEVWADREGNGWVLSVTEDDPAAEWAALPDSEARELRGKVPGQKRAWNQVEDELKRKRRRDDGLSDVMRRAEAVGRVDAPEATTLQSDVKVAFSFGAAPPVSNDDTWARPGLVVKARAGKKDFGGAFDKVKCVVRGVSNDGVAVETLDGRARATLPLAKLETVIPAVGKRVRVVGGAHKGDVATLEALDLGAFAARIRLEESGEVVEGVPYEDVCKERV